jgi:SAM-dependent methyltransferase
MFKKILQKLFPFLFSKKTHLAFGVEESPNRWPLDKARYPLMASLIHQESLKKQRKLRVLDLGCRDGNMLAYCRKNNSDVEFFGMDIVAKGLETALERGFKSVSEFDIRNRPYPYADDYFDVVICSHILEHLEEPGSVLDEVRRVLKDDGMLIVGVPIGLLPGILWRRHITPLLNPRKTVKETLKRYGHVTFFSLPELKRLLKQHGFQTEEARGDFMIRARKFFLEDHKWWFDLNQAYGKLFPGVLGHVTVRTRLKKTRS